MSDDCATSFSQKGNSAFFSFFPELNRNVKGKEIPAWSIAQKDWALGWGCFEVLKIVTPFQLWHWLDPKKSSRTSLGSNHRGGGNSGLEHKAKCSGLQLLGASSHQILGGHLQLLLPLSSLTGKTGVSSPSTVWAYQAAPHTLPPPPTADEEGSTSKTCQGSLLIDQDRVGTCLV